MLQPVVAWLQSETELNAEEQELVGSWHWGEEKRPNLEFHPDRTGRYWWTFGQYHDFYWRLEEGKLILKFWFGGPFFRGKFSDPFYQKEEYACNLAGVSRPFSAGAPDL